MLEKAKNGVVNKKTTKENRKIERILFGRELEEKNTTKCIKRYQKIQNTEEGGTIKKVELDNEELGSGILKTCNDNSQRYCNLLYK